MRILATLARPSAGKVTWNGIDIARDPNALRDALRSLPQHSGVYAALSAREFHSFLAAVKGAPRPCLGLVGLNGAADRCLGEFPRGMRQRVEIDISGLF